MKSFKADKLHLYFFGLSLEKLGANSLYAHRKPPLSDRFLNELNEGTDDAYLKSSHCIYFDGVISLNFEKAIPVGSYIDYYGGTSTLTLDITNKKITATIGTAWQITIKKADGSIWAELPCAEGAGVACFDVSGNNNHGYSSTYTSLASFRGSKQDSYHYNITEGYSNTFYVPYTNQLKIGVSGVNWNNNLTVVFSGKHIRSTSFLTAYFSSNSIIRVNIDRNPVRLDLFGNEVGQPEANFLYTLNINIAESWGCFFIMTIKYLSAYSYEVTVYNNSTSKTITTTHNLRAMNQSSNTALFFTDGANSTGNVEGVIYSACIWKRLLSSSEISAITQQTDKKYLDFSGISMTDMVMKVEKEAFSYNGTLQNGVGAFMKIPAVGNKDAIGNDIRRPSGPWHNGCETKLQSTSLGLFSYGTALSNPKFKKRETDFPYEESRFLSFQNPVPNPSKTLDYVINNFLVY